MKKIMCLFLIFVVFMTGCDNSTDSQKENEDLKSETKKDTSKAKNKKEISTINDKKNSTNTVEDASEEEKNLEKNVSTKSSEEVTKPYINLNNVVDRNILQSIIYNNNYNEYEKRTAYNSALANGILPQGNVIDGLTVDAYESSLRVESGAEKLGYNQNNVEQSNTTQDVNAEINNAKTKDEYINALRKKYNGGLSSGEIQTMYAIEQGYYDGDDAEEVYAELKRREAEVNAGMFNQYKK